MRPNIPSVAALLAAIAGFGAAPVAAAPGFATGAVNLRAGPGVTYPQVVVVPAGAPVEIIGCLPGFTWCDVGFGEVRGWVSARYLQSLDEDRRVPFPEYAPRAGVPVVGFAFGDYWGSHYRGRSWYAERDRWGGPPPPAAYGEPPRAGFREPPPGWRPGPPGPGPGWRPDERREGNRDWDRARRGDRQDWREGRPDGRPDGPGIPPGDRADWRQERQERRQQAREERREERREMREDRREERFRGRPE